LVSLVAGALVAMLTYRYSDVDQRLVGKVGYSNFG